MHFSFQSMFRSLEKVSLWNVFFKLEILSVTKKYGKGVIEKIEDTVIVI